MKIAREGSGLVLVMIVITALTVCAHTLMHTVVYARNAVHAQQRYVERVYAAEGLLNYGIACAQEHFDYVPDTEQSLVFDAWPVGNDKTHNGLVVLRSGEQGVQVEAHLVRENTDLCHLSCCVIRDEDMGQYVIEAWTMHISK